MRLWAAGAASIYSLKWWIVDGHGYEQCGCWHDLIKTAECGEEMQGRGRVLIQHFNINYP